MWAESFGILARQQRTLGRALMTARVLPARSKAFERASAVIAARLAEKVCRESHRFIIMTPPPAREHAHIVACGLLLADFSERNAPRLPPRRSAHLLDGDLLLVTHAVGESLEMLRSLQLGGESLEDIWAVDSYSRYRARSLSTTLRH